MLMLEFCCKSMEKQNSSQYLHVSIWDGENKYLLVVFNLLFNHDLGLMSK